MDALSLHVVLLLRIFDVIKLLKCGGIVSTTSLRHSTSLHLYVKSLSERHTRDLALPLVPGVNGPM